MKVLIVDGSLDHRRTIVEALSELTNIVVQGAVASMQTAIAALVDASPDLVVTSTVLSDGDGTQMIERMRGLERSPSIIVVTAAASDRQRVRYLAAGADCYVQGEDDMRQLQSAVAKMARKRRVSGTIPPAERFQLLGRMTAGVLHDLNNYLSVANLTTSVMRANREDPALWQQLDAAHAALGRLTSTLLEYARGISPPPTLLDFGALVRNTVAIAGRLIPESVTVTVDIASGVRGVPGLKSELEQLVLNLVVNACDAMPDGGDLEIKVLPTGSRAVLLQIADRGVGMADACAGRAAGGLGLGIVHAVLDRHLGAINFTARSDGGTLVSVLLPA